MEARFREMRDLYSERLEREVGWEMGCFVWRGAAGKAASLNPFFATIFQCSEVERSTRRRVEAEQLEVLARLHHAIRPPYLALPDFPPPVLLPSPHPSR